MSEDLPGPFARFIRARAGLIGVFAGIALVVGVLLSQQAYASLEERRDVAEISRWGEEAHYTYAVPVTRNSTVWAVGTVLGMGEPAYFRSISEFFWVNFTWAPRAATGVAHAEMIVRVSAEGDDGAVFWQIEKPLANATVANATQGLTLRGILLLDPLVSDVSRAQQSMPPGGGLLNWTIETTVKYAVAGDGVRAADKARYLLPMRVLDPRWSLPRASELQFARDHVETEERVTLQRAGMGAVLSTPSAWGLTFLGAIGVALAVWGYASNPWRKVDSRTQAYEAELAEHAEWITRTASSVPLGAGDVPVVDVAALEDLVQIAGEGRTRVLLDPARRTFYVLLPSATYRYAKHAPPSAVSFADDPLAGAYPPRRMGPLRR